MAPNEMHSLKINLKIAFLNAENLFLLFDSPPHKDILKADGTQWQRLSTSIYENKPLDKLKELAKAIKEIDADIVMLCEIGGPESLANFNELFLDSKYSSALIEGNSNRNIDVGFLVRKELPFYFDLASNKNRSINFVYPHEKSQNPPPVNKFSRDVAELKCFTKNVDQPFLILLLTHLKSRLDPERKDTNGFERRKAELKTLVEIEQEIEKNYPSIPIVMAGDFNGNAGTENTDEEFKPIYQSTSLKDILELANAPGPDRATFYQVKAMGKTESRQIDYCFLNPVAAQKLKSNSSSVYRYKDEFGFKIDIPQNLEAKMQLPSDHYPLVFELAELILG
ncbi:MAG: hypothetical protein AABY64_04915 [Bdellovibrionota bacterium]